MCDMFCKTEQRRFETKKNAISECFRQSSSSSAEVVDASSEIAHVIAK